MPYRFVPWYFLIAVGVGVVIMVLKWVGWV